MKALDICEQASQYGLSGGFLEMAKQLGSGWRIESMWPSHHGETAVFGKGRVEMDVMRVNCYEFTICCDGESFFQVARTPEQVQALADKMKALAGDQGPELVGAARALRLAQAPPSYSDPASTKLSYEELKAGLPAGVDPTKKEQYLTDEDFEKILKVPRSQFNEMQAWKQQQLKQAASLH